MVTLSALSAILGLMGPLFQKNFLDRLSHSPQFSWLKFEWLIGLAPMPLLLLAFLSLLLSLGLYQAVLYIGSRESYMMQRILSQRIFDHTLKLRLESLRGRSVGEVVSIYTVDVPGATILLEQSLPQGLTIFFPLTLAPWVLIHYFDIPAWNLCLVLGSVLALNFILALRQSRFFALFKRLAAERVGFVNEWVQNMRSLRILGWIPVFEQKIYHVREVETQNRISMLNNGQTMNGIASSVTFLLNVYLISLLLHLRQEAVTPGTLLALLWIVGVFLTRSFRQMPWFFTFVFDGWTSLKRVADLLSLHNLDLQPRPESFQKLHPWSQPSIPALDIQGLSFELDGRKLLDQLSFHVDTGEFLAVVGEVGSGKSLLLLSLMGETGATFEKYGLGLDEFNVTSVSLPEELQAALDERISAGMKGGLGKDKMAGFTQYQVASSIPLAAQNEGGLAGLGAGLASGVAFGQVMSQGMTAPAAAVNTAAPAEEPIEARLEKLKGLLDKGLISAADYDTAKAELLKKLIG